MAAQTPDLPVKPNETSGSPTGLRFAFFAVAAILLPLVVLVLIELTLRLAGAADAQRSVFIPVDADEEYLALNPDYVARYFSGFVPGVAFNPFEAAKGDSTFRVFVLGGSTTAGFPYRFYHGFPERLSAQLEATRFGQRVEVINLGMSAVNSYTVLDLTRAALQHEPDALVIYAGHNEFYGAFGTGSTESGLGGWHWMKRLVIRLRHSALYTLAENLVTDAPAPTTSERTLMARVVRESEIPQDGPVFSGALTQFSANMAEAIQAAVGAGVPVHIGTVASNLADQPPLSSNGDALGAYGEGQRLLAGGDTIAARRSFVLAKEHDGMRFRAPEAINDWIRANGELLGANLVDIEARFQAASPGGIEGRDLFTDHLHPNATGYQLMATAFHEQFDASASPITSIPDASIDDLDRAHADLLIKRLLGDFPFTKGASDQAVRSAYESILQGATRAGPGDSLAVLVIRGQFPFMTAQQELSEILRARTDTLGALRSYHSLLAWQPFNTTLRDRVLQFGLPSVAASIETDRIALKAASRKRDLFSLNALAATRLRLGYLADARVVLEQAEHIDPADQTMLFNTARLLIQEGDTLAARGYFERYQAARAR